MPSFTGSPPLVLLGTALVAGLTAYGAAGAQAANTDAALSALLKKQTQAFSEAGQKGDAAALAQYLDDDVVFTNETGAIVTKRQLVDGATPNPSPRPIQVTNWALRRQGNVATSTFIDEVTAKFETQTLVLRFQSTETWAKRQGGWKMIASHTMNVQRDPAAITLPAVALDEYVGTYQVDPSLVTKIARDGDHLVSATNGGTPAPLAVEIKDVLFTPGVPNLRRIFERDAVGSIIGYISRRDGADLIVKKIG
jgi:ketosteroid isomerase-like protein